MNLLGKILTLLIFVLSLSFLIVAAMVGMSHQNWREQAEENAKLARQYLEAKVAIQEQVTKKDQRLKEEQVARTLQLQQLQSQLIAAERNLDQRATELAAAQVTSKESLASMKAAEERLASQDTEVAQLRADIKTLVEDISAQREKVVSLTNDLFELQGTNRDLKTMVDDLAAENARWTKVATALGFEQDDLTDYVPPELNGVITSVNNNLIVVNLGTDDGLQKGHALDIVRGSRYVGSAEVTDARHNKSVARLRPELSRTLVQAGDRVTTQWTRPQTIEGGPGN
jgi:hypothetical protein